MANQILVIRFSGENGYNPKLREALTGTYDPYMTPAFPMPMGGVISVLTTDLTFEQIVEIVREANCGEPCLVVDSFAALRGETKSEMIYSDGPVNIGTAPESAIAQEIQRLLDKDRNRTITEEESERLAILLESDPN